MFWCSPHEKKFKKCQKMSFLGFIFKEMSGVFQQFWPGFWPFVGPKTEKFSPPLQFQGKRSSKFPIHPVFYLFLYSMMLSAGPSLCRWPPSVPSWQGVSEASLWGWGGGDSQPPFFFYPKLKPIPPLEGQCLPFAK